VLLTGLVYLLLRQLQKAYIYKKNYRIPILFRKRVIPYTKGKYKEINVLTLKTYQLYLTNYVIHVNIPVKIDS